MPLTLSGKIDYDALPSGDAPTASTRLEPRTPQEQILSSLFSELLSVPTVALHDSFFELGGDSIISIQLVSRAQKAGLTITISDVFEYQTIEALAAVAKPLYKAPIHPDIGAGPLVATPIIRCLMDLRQEITYGFHQSMLIQVPPDLTLNYLVTTLQALLDYHDALRLRVSYNTPQWQLEILPAGAISSRGCIHRVDVIGVDLRERVDCLKEESEAAISRLRPEDGIMVQIVWFDAGRTQPGQLLVAAHHLVVDGVSWRILLPDLKSIWEAIVVGRKPERRQKEYLLQKLG